jgi:hypothetical protein
MKKFVFSFAFIFLLLVVSKGYSQSAVYFCTETGAYGFAYGYSTESEAKTEAYNTCVSYGGTNPVLITSTYQKGYGAIALGNDANGNRVIGVAVGFSTLSGAKNEALKQCRDYGGYDVKIENTWNDN